MEKFIYEIRPYFFMTLAIVAVAARPNELMVVSSMVLLAASAHIVRSRRKHRAWLAT
jgi:hypothetical protein